MVQRPKDKILSMDPKEITYEMVQKKLQEIALARGKTTRIDRQEQVSCSVLLLLNSSAFWKVQRSTKHSKTYWCMCRQFP